MKRKKFSYILSVVAIIAMLYISGCCKPEISGNVANTLRPQETGNWCWAATTQMLADHFDISVQQCDLANHRFNKTNCCDPDSDDGPCPKTDDCNSPGNLELAFAGLSFDQSGTALSWKTLRKQIYCSKKPMGYSYGTPGIVGHVLVIKGYITLAGTNYLILNDPWAPCEGQERIITYDQYADPAGSSTHWNTWYNLAEN